MRQVPYMYEELLTDIGLTKSEIAVYFALLELGSSTTGSIIKMSEIASGKAYIVLNKLVLKGLVTHVIKAGTKHYQAKDPERLIDYLKEKEEGLKEKEEKLKQIIPNLKARYEKEKYKPLAEIFEGIKGFKTFMDFMLKETGKGNHINIMGVSREVNEKFGSYLIGWNKKRVEMGIKLRIIYNHDSKEFGKLREKMKLTEVRYMKPEIETPALIDIFGDYIATVNVHNIPVVFLIKNKETGEAYRKYFEIIWGQSEPS